MTGLMFISMVHKETVWIKVHRCVGNFGSLEERIVKWYYELQTAIIVFINISNFRSGHYELNWIWQREKTFAGASYTKSLLAGILSQTTLNYRK